MTQDRIHLAVHRVLDLGMLGQHVERPGDGGRRGLRIGNEQDAGMVEQFLLTQPAPTVILVRQHIRHDAVIAQRHSAMIRRSADLRLDTERSNRWLAAACSAT
jgi:hypothetical protein